MEVKARKLDGANTLFTLGTIQRITCDDRSRRSSSSSYTYNGPKRTHLPSLDCHSRLRDFDSSRNAKGRFCLLYFEGGSSVGAALRTAVLRPSVEGVGSQQPFSAKRPTTDYPSTTMGSFVNYLAAIYYCCYDYIGE